MNNFAQRIDRIRSLRRNGMSVVQYVQAAGVPAMMYGDECTGIADTALKKTVSLAAAEVSLPTM